MRQFIYVSATVGVVFLMYFLLQSWIWLILAAVVLATGFSFAFVKVNGQKLSFMARAAFLFYWSPQLYLWQPEAPNLQKTPQAIQERTSAGFDIERIVSGFALKRAWEFVQTGSRADVPPPAQDQKLRYQVFRKVTGELQAAKRIDYIQ